MSRPQKTHLAENNELISTREALLRAVLKLVEHKSFDAISLREVTREAGVSPAAFYRHFDNMEHLGLTIVEESFAILREGLKLARTDTQQRNLIGLRSIECLNQFGISHPLHYRFICSNTHSAAAAIRNATSKHTEILRQDLAEDLRNTPELQHLSRESLDMIADHLKTTVINIAAEILIGGESEEKRQKVTEKAVKQIRLITLGALQWRDKPKAPSAT